jgi:hypothetical protein
MRRPSGRLYLFATGLLGLVGMARKKANWISETARTAQATGSQNNSVGGIVMNTRLLAVAWVFALTLCYTPAQADILSVTQDTYVSGTDPSTNYGDDPQLRLSDWSPSNAFLQFEASTGGTVDSAVS